MLMHTHTTYLLLSLVLVTIAACTDGLAMNFHDSQTEQATTVLPISPTPAPSPTLADAIEDWIGLLEADDLPSASERWAKDDEAKTQLERFWGKLRTCNEQYDYRNWLEAAGEADGENSFTVGGHSYGFLHTDWVATPLGWRIRSVWACR
jgi:hypothetical protein